jgi:hypothetical protein
MQSRLDYLVFPYIHSHNSWPSEKRCDFHLAEDGVNELMFVCLKMSISSRIAQLNSQADRKWEQGWKERSFSEGQGMDPEVMTVMATGSWVGET